MPELPILDASGRLHEAARDILVAIMVYPKDEERQEEYLAAVLVEKYQDDPDAFSTLAGELPWIVAALSRPRTAGGVIAAAKRATGSAWAAGEILLVMLAASLHHPTIKIELTKTIDTVDKFYRGTPDSIANRTLWGVWSKFRSVSHFYAVRRMWDVSVQDPEGMQWEDWITNDFDEYLAVANDICDMALTRRFLTYEEVWRVPESIDLPPARMLPDVLLPEVLDLFHRHRPKHSKA